MAAQSVDRPGYDELVSEVRSRMEWNVPTARHVSWRAGGPVHCLFRPASIDELIVGLRLIEEDGPIEFFGLGSNLLVRDGGFKGTMVMTHPALAGLDVIASGEVHAGAGVPCAKIAKAAARAGLTECAFLAGIPGTLGGALAMNAGAFGGETWQYVREVETIDRRGDRHRRAKDEFTVGYRRATLRDHVANEEWFLGALLEFPLGDARDSEREIRETLARRSASQPTGVASCGSVFRNPENGYAGQLIEEAGLKGHRIGGSVVAEAHANFIINDQNATASDIEALIEHVIATVEDHAGVQLIPEVRIIGERPETIVSGRRRLWRRITWPIPTSEMGRWSWAAPRRSTRFRLPRGKPCATR